MQLGKIQTSHKAKYPVQTLEKALEIIEVMYNEGASGLGISEIDNKLGFGKSTIHRILDTLMAYNYVEKCTDSTKYRLSWKFYEIGSNIPKQRNLSNIDMNILRKICDKYDETVNFGVRVDNDVIIVYRQDAQSTLIANIPVGTREPLYATAMGKAIISELSIEELKDIFKDEVFKSYTSNTITTFDELVRELEKVREQGYSIDDQEYYPGLSCIAVPVRNYKNEIVAAISVSGPSTRLNFSKIMDIKDDLILASKEISAHLGYSDLLENK